MTSHATHKNPDENCKSVAEHLQLELDSKLRSIAFRKVRQHLAKCPNCAAYLDSLKKTVTLYKRLPCPRISKQAREELFAALRFAVRTH